MGQPNEQKLPFKTRWEILGAGIILTAIFLGLVITGNINWGADFKDSILVKIENVNRDPQSLIKEIETTAGTTGISGISDNLILVELPLSYSDELAAKIENTISGAGAIEVLQIAPLLEPSVFHALLKGIALGLAIIAVFLLLVFRRKRMAWLFPLLLGVTIGETLAICIFANLPMGIGTMTGVVLLLLYLIGTGSKLLVHPMRLDEKTYQKLRGIFLPSFGVLLCILLISSLLLGLETQLALALIVVGIGGGLGCLNYATVLVPAIQEKKATEVVKYHVSV